MTADMEQALGKFIGEQNPFAEMQLHHADGQLTGRSGPRPAVARAWTRL
jgi:hypothetical protein